MKTEFTLDQFNEAEVLTHKLKNKIEHINRCEIIDDITDCTILKLIILSLTRENKNY